MRGFWRSSELRVIYPREDRNEKIRSCLLERRELRRTVENNVVEITN